MKHTTVLMLCAFMFAGSLVLIASQHTSQSPYMDLQGREIKALSGDEKAALLNGDGMGFALAAELNHYPGPKHILELQEEIGLSPEQLATVQASFDRMRQEAQKLGHLIVEAERSLDGRFQSGDLEANGLREAVTSIGILRGRLRAVHLTAHLEMKSLLDPTQIMAYVQARGYAHRPH